jgi:hypothetical protein
MVELRHQGGEGNYVHPPSMADRPRGGRDEVTMVLSAAAPDLHQALARVAEEGRSHVILDGKIFAIDRIAERAGVTVTADRYWINGGRGPGSFPQPRVARARGSLYSRASWSRRTVSAKSAAFCVSRYRSRWISPRRNR